MPAASVLVALAALSACDRPPACPPRESPEYYFPAATAAPSANLDDFFRRWYSLHLRALGEPSLSCGDGSAHETYRFTWLRTFHHPISIRISRRLTGASIHVVESDGAGGYEPGRVIRQETRPLTQFDWNALVTMFRQAVATTRADGGIGGPDGSQWVFEASTSEGYQFRDDWSPDAGPARVLGERLLELAAVRVPAREMY